MRHIWCFGLRAATALLTLWVLGKTAQAAPAATPLGPSPLAPHASAAPQSAGRPQIKLDRLEFPTIPDASYYKSYLRRSLQRASASADWGAGAGSVIEYRFRVDRLEIETAAGLVRVHCQATGELPANKRATSRLTFSGKPSERRQLVQRVLQIVARGVITRLAQIEHRRRQRG